MKQEIKIPSMGESITEVTIGSIFKEQGSFVKTDDEILELETDKVNQVLYAPQAGKLELSVKSEDVKKIGEVIGYVDTDQKGPVGQEKPVELAPAPGRPVLSPHTKIPSQTLPPQAAVPPVKPVLSQPESQQVRQTKDQFVESLREPQPSSVTQTSSSAPLPSAQSSPGDRSVVRKKMSKIRKVIAQRLVQAQQSTAMLTTFNEVDMTAVMQLRDRYKESFLKEHGVKLGFMSFFVKAALSALKAVPQVNSFIDGEDLVERTYFDIGIAVGTERGLIVPVIRNCDQLTFAGIEQAIEQFAKKAREGTITADDLQGGCFTITNGGVYGSLMSTPILNPPQSGILGMHKIQKRPMAVNDQVVIRPMMYLALSYDHRVIDGKEAVTFLVHIKDCLEDPSRLLLGV